MAYTPITEYFNCGLVTARHGALLQPGELQRADDCVYREKDPSIWRAPGRTQYGTVVTPSRVFSGLTATGASAVVTSAFDEFVRVGQTVTISAGTATLPAATTVASIVRDSDGVITSITLSNVFGGTTNVSATLTFTVEVIGLAYLPFENALSPKVLAFAGQELYSLPINFSSGTETSTEIGGPSRIQGDIVTTTVKTFTANTGKPFLTESVGARVFSGLVTSDSIYVLSVTGTPTNGRYPAITIGHTDGTIAPTALTGSDIYLALEWGCIQTYQQAASPLNDILDVAQYGASYFSWTGADELRKIEWLTPPNISGSTTNKVLSSRPVGLNPVTQVPTLALLTGNITGTSTPYAWPASLPTGYYWFLVTEIYLPNSPLTGKGDDAREVESSYAAIPAGKTAGEPIPILIADHARGVRVTLPAQVNTGERGRLSTHWGIYMSQITTEDNVTRPSLATFKRIVKSVPIVGTAAGQVVDLFVNVVSQVFFPTAVAVADGGPTFTNDANLANDYTGGVLNIPTTEIGKVASSRTNSGTDGGAAIGAISQLTYPFVLTTPFDTQTVTGMFVTVVGRRNGSGNAQNHADYYFYLWDGGAKRSPIQTGRFTTDHNEAQGFGGPNDSFGVTWGIGSAMTGFRIVIGGTKETANERLEVDTVAVRMFFSSGQMDLNGKAYRVVTYRDQIGTSITDPAYGLPPVCSTADFFNGMLVMNDLSDETALRYTLPGTPEATPKPYVLRLNSGKKRDKVTCIRTLGQVLIAGMENSSERVNYLPKEINTDLTDGLSHEELSPNVGIAGPLAAVKFDMGNGTVLAFASASGCFSTNGITVRPLEMDLNWAATVKLSALGSCVFKCYPKEKWLVLYYCPFGASHNRNTRALVFSYAMDKIKEGGFLPCTGPISVSSRSACEVNTNGTSYILTGSEINGKIYVEDSGVLQATGYQVHNATDVPASAPILPVPKSRRFYPAGFDRDGYGEKFYLLFSNYGTNSVTAASVTTKDSVTITSTAAFGSVVAGMRILGTGIDPGTIVLAVGSTSSLTLSRAANTSGSVTLTFDTGTVGVSIRGSNLGEAVKGLSTDYISTLVGDLVSFNRSNIRRGFELQIEKVPLTFDGNGDTATSTDLGVNMRLHSLTYMVGDGGPDTNRNAS